MPNNSKSNEKDQKYWQTHVQQWQASQLKMSTYCREQNISIYKFKYWRYRLLPKTKKTPTPTPAPKLFNQVNLTEPRHVIEKPDSAIPFEFIINKKLSLKVPTTFHGAELKRLLRLLEVI